MGCTEGKASPREDTGVPSTALRGVEGRDVLERASSTGPALGWQGGVELLRTGRKLAGVTRTVLREEAGNATLGRRLVAQGLLTNHDGCCPTSRRRPREGWVGRTASRFCLAAPHLGCSVSGHGIGPRLARR